MVLSSFLKNDFKNGKRLTINSMILGYLLHEYWCLPSKKRTLGAIIAMVLSFSSSLIKLEITFGLKETSGFNIK